METKKKKKSISCPINCLFTVKHPLKETGKAIDRQSLNVAALLCCSSPPTKSTNRSRRTGTGSWHVSSLCMVFIHLIILLWSERDPLGHWYWRFNQLSGRLSSNHRLYSYYFCNSLSWYLYFLFFNTSNWWCVSSSQVVWEFGLFWKNPFSGNTLTADQWHWTFLLWLAHISKKIFPSQVPWIHVFSPLTSEQKRKDERGFWWTVIIREWV